MGSRRIALITVPKKKQQYKIILGIDFDNPKAKNEIAYLRLADTRNKVHGTPKTVGEELWLTLDDMDKLGVLFLLLARFWAKTRKKGERKEASAFREFWKSLREEWPTLKPYVPSEDEE